MLITGQRHWNRMEGVEGEEQRKRREGDKDEDGGGGRSRGISDIGREIVK